MWPVCLRWLTRRFLIRTRPVELLRALPSSEFDCTKSDRADVRFTRPNIQIYDVHVVDLHQLVCARYLVDVKGAETKARRSKVRLSTELQNGSRGFPNAVLLEPVLGNRKRAICFIFQ